MAAKLTALDILTMLAVVIRVLFFELPWFSISLAFGFRPRSEASYNIPLSKLVQLFLLRKIASSLPLNTLRWSTDIGLPHKVLESPRYKPHQSNIFSEISVSPSHSDAGFRGRWIVRGLIDKASSPSECDMVIYFLHGGGYNSSSPASYLVFLLRIAECLNSHGVSVGIFALDYDLAPETRFPGQLTQARAAYEWLVADVGPEWLLVMGDSAGGHLSLSLMVDLAKAEVPMTKPGLGLMLLSPWISLGHVCDSFERNEMTDILSKDLLKKCARRFVGKVDRSNVYTEFLSADTEWNSVLPDWVWASAGKNEIMYDDILRWIVERGSDCEGTNRINGEIDRDEPHDYAWLATTDAVVRKQFLELPLEKNEFEEFEAIDRIARVIIERHKSLR